MMSLSSHDAHVIRSSEHFAKSRLYFAAGNVGWGDLLTEIITFIRQESRADCYRRSQKVFHFNSTSLTCKASTFSPILSDVKNVFRSFHPEKNIYLSFDKQT